MERSVETTEAYFEKAEHQLQKLCKRVWPGKQTTTQLRPGGLQHHIISSRTSKPGSFVTEKPEHPDYVIRISRKNVGIPHLKTNLEDQIIAQRFVSECFRVSGKRREMLPNLAEIHSFDCESQSNELGRPYIIMKRIAGEPLLGPVDNYWCLELEKKVHVIQQYVGLLSALGSVRSPLPGYICTKTVNGNPVLPELNEDMDKWIRKTVIKPHPLGNDDKLGDEFESIDIVQGADLIASENKSEKSEHNQTELDLVKDRFRRQIDHNKTPIEIVNEINKIVQHLHDKYGCFKLKGCIYILAHPDPAGSNWILRKDDGPKTKAAEFPCPVGVLDLDDIKFCPVVVDWDPEGKDWLFKSGKSVDENLKKIFFAEAEKTIKKPPGLTKSFRALMENREHECERLIWRSALYYLPDSTGLVRTLRTEYADLMP